MEMLSQFLISMELFNVTPAHSDDAHVAIIENSDMEVITPAGGQRRKPNTIAIGDTVRLKRQKSFFPMFPRPSSDTE
jgi:hypothetical protein